RLLRRLGLQNPVDEMEAIALGEDARGDHRLVLIDSQAIDRPGWRRPFPGVGRAQELLRYDRGHAIVLPDPKGSRPAQVISPIITPIRRFSPGDAGDLGDRHHFDRSFVPGGCFENDSKTSPITRSLRRFRPWRISASASGSSGDWVGS